MIYLLIPLLLVILILLISVMKLKKTINIYKKNLVEIKSKALETEENNLLKEILRASYEKEELSKATRKICNIIKSNYNTSYCSILLFNEREGFKIISSNIEKEYILDIENYCNEIFNKLDSNKEIAIIQCSDRYLQYPSADKRKIEYLYFIPLYFNDTEERKITGGLLIEDKKRDNIEKIEGDFFKTVIESITISLQNLIYYDKIVALHMTDELTQVYNRRYMEKFINEEITRLINTTETFTLVIFDIDHFKKFNDTYGHPFGDKVLKIVSTFVKENIRQNYDQVFRYGGEEFIIYFKNTNNKDIFHKLDKIREDISSLELITENNEMVNVTISFGMAEYSKHGTTIKKLIDNADQALYKAKEKGRNRIIAYEDIK